MVVEALQKSKKAHIASNGRRRSQKNSGRQRRKIGSQPQRHRHLYQRWRSHRWNYWLAPRSCVWRWKIIFINLWGKKTPVSMTFLLSLCYPEVPVAIPSPKRPVVQRTSPAPLASSSSTSSSCSSSNSSVTKTRPEVDKDMQRQQKFNQDVTAALDRLTKAVEKQTAELQRIASHPER